MPYHTLVFLTSLYTFLFSFFLFILSVFLCFLFLFSIYVSCCSSSFSLCCCLLCTAKTFYTACRDKIYHFTPQLFLAYCGCPSLATHQSPGCPATTTTLSAPCSIPRQSEFCFILQWVFSLTNSYGMHLTILAHLSLFGWYVIPAGHLP